MNLLFAQFQAFLTWVAVTGALVYWIRSWRRSRTPSLLAMVKALAALDLALLIGADYGVRNWAFGIATLPNYIVHVLALASAYWLQLFVLYLAHPAESIPDKTRTRTRILIVAQLALAALYVLGPISGEHPSITASAGVHPMFAVYLMVFVIYLGLAMFDVFHVARHARDLPKSYLRTGLLLLRWGGAAGLAFVVHKALSSLALQLKFTPPWVQAVNAVLPGVLTTSGILLLMAGVTVPAVFPRYALRRHYRDLEPLWRDLIAFAPEVRFIQNTSRRGIGADITDRIRTRVTEIHDVLVGPLRIYLDPATSGTATQPAAGSAATGDPDAATVQAVTIATALRSAEQGTPVNAEQPVTFIPATTTDYRDEAAWLATVARAYATSPVVATIREETTRHADPVH